MIVPLPFNLDTHIKEVYESFQSKEAPDFIDIYYSNMETFGFDNENKGERKNCGL